MGRLYQCLFRDPYFNFTPVVTYNAVVLTIMMRPVCPGVLDTVKLIFKSGLAKKARLFSPSGFHKDLIPTNLIKSIPRGIQQLRLDTLTQDSLRIQKIDGSTIKMNTGPSRARAKNRVDFTSLSEECDAYNSRFTGHDKMSSRIFGEMLLISMILFKDTILQTSLWRISGVQLTSDRRLMTVKWTLDDAGFDEATVESFLQAVTPRIRYELSKKINWGFIPAIRFIRDQYDPIKEIL